MKIIKLLIVIFSLAVIVSCKQSKEISSSKLNTETNGNSTFAITNVNIIPMTEPNTVINDATVVVKDEKILSVNGLIPSSAKIINGKGKWLIPGLVDMHVHNLADINLSADYPTKGATLFTDTQDFMLLFVANGVTTVFELSARVEHFGQRNEIISGKVLGPRIALALLINGGEGGNTANSPVEGRQTVKLAKAQGYEFIKVYSQLNSETYKAIVNEAERLDMKVIGHIPNVFDGNTRDAFVPNFEMVSHAEEFAKHAREYTLAEAKEFAQIAKENGTWFTPTLTVMERIVEQSKSLDGIHDLESLKYVHPLMQSKWIVSNQYFKNTSPQRTEYLTKIANYNKVLVDEFKKVGVPIVAGTDAGTSGVVWGFSLHDEIELLVDAGLTPEEALISATRLPAEWLGISDKIGTIEVGKFSDLLLLDENPLENISNTRKIAGVFANGRWISKDEIDFMLSNLAQKNESKLDKYDWEKRRDL